jgi:ParB-like chromosome segregation protein Spo0J
MKIHPMADLFPMHTEEMLQDLAASIKAHGLRHPIVLDKEGQIIDGRNRFAACKIAGVEPQFRTEEGDPIDYIQDEEAYRKLLTKSQLAMATAIRYPESQHGGDRKSAAKSSLPGKLDSVSKTDLSMARTVLRELPLFKDQVLAGASLKDAYQVVLDQRRAKENREAQIKEQEALIARQKQEAERTLANLKAQQEKKITELKLAIEEIGPEPELKVPTIPSMRDLPSVKETSTTEIRTVSDNLFPKLEEQRSFLGSLSGSIQSLKRLKNEGPISLAPRSQHLAVCSAAIQVMNLASEIYNQHKNHLAKPQLKGVK